MSGSAQGAPRPFSPGRWFATWAPLGAYMIFIWWLSGQQVRVPLEFVPLRDKALHFMEFGALGFVSARATLNFPAHSQRGCVPAIGTIHSMRS